MGSHGKVPMFPECRSLQHELTAVMKICWVSAQGRRYFWHLRACFVFLHFFERWRKWVAPWFLYFIWYFKGEDALKVRKQVWQWKKPSFLVSCSVRMGHDMLSGSCSSAQHQEHLPSSLMLSSFSLEQAKSFIGRKALSKHWLSKFTKCWHSTPILCKSRMDLKTTWPALYLECMISFSMQLICSSWNQLVCRHQSRTRDFLLYCNNNRNTWCF